MGVDVAWHTGQMAKPLQILDVAPLTSNCCPPLSDAPLAAKEATELALRLKALADPTRLRLISLLMASDTGEACTCDLTEPLGISQPTVTHHLKKLVAAGLLSGERRGVWTHYRVLPDALNELAAVISPTGSMESHSARL